MPSHVALLRGINVGGRNKVAMADLRKVVLTRANVAGADVSDADLTGTILLSLRGRAELRGLDRARNANRAISDEPIALGSRLSALGARP